MSTADIKTVGVLGAGQMGLGIAQVAAQSGYKTILVKATPGDTAKLQEKILLNHPCLLRDVTFC